MLNQPTIEKLHNMKLHGMADGFRAQLETADASQLSFEVLFTLLAERYERGSVFISSNLPFSKWEGIFKDP